MDNIQVAVLGPYGDPGATMAFLGRLTQRGHSIKNMDDLLELYNKDASDGLINAMARLPHGTIKRFTPITVAIVGASRRFLAQARTNQVGFNYVSASLQYSDYSDKATFVVPYALMEADVEEADAWVQNTPFANEAPDDIKHKYSQQYLQSCVASMATYKALAGVSDNDTAGYVAPQGLRNILIMQGNHQSWDYFIRTRICNRNTAETQYVTALIWDALLKTTDGEAFFGRCGADCAYGGCREGKMACGNPMRKHLTTAKELGITVPQAIIHDKWPLIYNGGNA